MALGARLIHLVDFDGARAGAPANLEAVGAIAARDRRPAPGRRRRRFGRGDPAGLRGRGDPGRADHGDRRRSRRPAGVPGVAGDWLAVGLDPRPERLAAFPWRRPVPPTVDGLVGELVGAGVARFVLSHGGAEPDLARTRELVRSYDAEILVAGGVHDLDGLRRLRDTGVAGVILGEALLSGAIDYPAALEAAA